jgi:putative transposase
MPDHVHMCVSIPPKYAVAHVVGYLKGKSAIHVARRFGGRKRNFTGGHFWARGYFVSTVGLDEAMVRVYIRNQESGDRRYDQMQFGLEG